MLVVDDWRVGEVDPKVGSEGSLSREPANPATAHGQSQAHPAAARLSGVTILFSESRSEKSWEVVSPSLGLTFWT